MDPVEVVTRYLSALESRAPVERIEALLAEDATIAVLPNRLDPRGTERGRAEALADVARGRALLARERYEVLGTVREGDRVALEVAWTGVLAVSLGALEPGAELRGRCAMFFRVVSGRIVAQRNYDCFEAF